MLKIVISVKDTVAEFFNDPRVELNAASAIRSFTVSVKETPHKDDFALYQVGVFDTETGLIKPNDPIRLFTGHDVKLDNVSSISMEQQVDDLAKHEMLKKQA